MQIFEQEEKRVRYCHLKISKLMYGRDGLIAFMYNIFGFFEPNEMCQVNYYFAIKDQIE